MPISGYIEALRRDAAAFVAEWAERHGYTKNAWAMMNPMLGWGQAAEIAAGYMLRCELAQWTRVGDGEQFPMAGARVLIERGGFLDPSIRVVEQAQFYPASVTPHGWLSAAGEWVQEAHVHMWRPLPVPPVDLRADQKGEAKCP